MNNLGFVGMNILSNNFSVHADRALSIVCKFSSDGAIRTISSAYNIILTLPALGVLTPAFKSLITVARLFRKTEKRVGDKVSPCFAQNPTCFTPNDV